MFIALQIDEEYPSFCLLISRRIRIGLILPIMFIVGIDSLSLISKPIIKVDIFKDY